MSDVLAAVIAGVAAFIGAGLGAVVTLRTARAAEVEAGREEWYRRFQYVANLLLTGSERARSAGIGLLHVLLADPHAGPTEKELAASLLRDVVDTGEARRALAAVGVGPADLLVARAAPAGGPTGAAAAAAEVSPGWSRLRWTATGISDEPEPGAAAGPRSAARSDSAAGSVRATPGGATAGWATPAARAGTGPSGSVPVTPDQVRAARELLLLRGAAGVHPVIATIAWLRETP